MAKTFWGTAAFLIVVAGCPEPEELRDLAEQPNDFFDVITFRGASVTDGWLNPYSLEEIFKAHLASVSRSDQTLDLPNLFVGLDYFSPTSPVITRAWQHPPVDEKGQLDENQFRDDIRMLPRISTLYEPESQFYDRFVIGLLPDDINWRLAVRERGPATFKEMRAVINSELLRLAEENPSLVLVDLDGLISDGQIHSLAHPGRRYEKRMIFHPDLIHPNRLGQRVLLNYLVAALNPASGYNIPFLPE